MAVATNRTLLGPGDSVGRYEIVAEIAQGGMATVYVARLSSIGNFDKLVAIKVLLPHLRSDGAFVNMLLDEARISGAIHHGNVVQVLDIAEHDGTPYVAMELLRGRSLRHVYKDARKVGEALPPGLVMGVLARAAEGLDAAHSAKDATGEDLHVVHRDVSPENIHVGYDGQTKVLDFGIAAAAGRLTETTHGELKGKMRYLAPEQLSKARPADKRVDVWALGVVAHELLACRSLFTGEDMSTTIWNVLHKEVPNVREFVPELPRATARVLHAAISRNPDDRPESCAVLMAAFDEAAAALGGGSKAEVAAFMVGRYDKERSIEDERIAAAVREGPAPPLVEALSDADEDAAPPTVRDREPKRTRRLGVALAALGLLAAIGVGLYATNDGTSRPNAAVAAPSESFDRAPDQPAADEAPTPRAEAAVPEDQTEITIEVDERARVVLVDGERHDERPLALFVGRAPRVVELIGADGEMQSWELSAADDGASLRLPDRPGVSRSRRARGMRRGSSGRMDSVESSDSTDMAEPNRDIVRDVF